jgi:hypothetical protein
MLVKLFRQPRRAAATGKLGRGNAARRLVRSSFVAFTTKKTPEDGEITRFAECSHKFAHRSMQLPVVKLAALQRALAKTTCDGISRDALFHANSSYVGLDKNARSTVRHAV